MVDESLNLLIPVTRKCATDIQDLEFSAVDLATRVLRLNERHYDKSMWCKRSKSEGVKVPEEMLWLPCDAYTISHRERMSVTGRECDVEYYFKLCLTPMKTVVMLVSVHL